VTDITRTTTACSNGDTLSKSLEKSDNTWTLDTHQEPSISTAELPLCQALGESHEEKAILPIRLALAQSDVSLTEGLIDRLSAQGIEVPLVATPEFVFRRVNSSPREFDFILYPIYLRWQPALDFSQQLRRLRESWGASCGPRILVLSFADHYGTTVQSFMRTTGTRYARFISEENVFDLLRSMQHEMFAERGKSRQLHLRFVHAGNPNGYGCIRGEKIVAVYASFQLGEEDQLDESASVLRFLNLLASYRLSKSAHEIVVLMRTSPLYVANGDNALSVSSIKTYVARAETLFIRNWHRRFMANEPPSFIARERRGGKEVGYRLLASSEIDHV
jgi:hypothetical protein